MPECSSIPVECWVQAPPFTEEQTWIFEPRKNPQWPEGLESVIHTMAAFIPKIIVSVKNPTNHDIKMGERTATSQHT